MSTSRLYVYGKSSMVGITVDSKTNREYYTSKGFEVSTEPLAHKSVANKYKQKGGK
ncbi:hypothetical protein QE320_gp132 [Pseudomonas phage EM]|uniref:Uncharacterized protein n=1 Tax=Pseudomonas phage EM TaxID=2936914 RepID=A0AAE9HLY4_9CAUD|nr:hypothetical protein QE320_gp132 [Pseudomonas phage EM]UPW35922.1 hypothetical protein EM_137 [Pseudomonas phage EM]